MGIARLFLDIDGVLLNFEHAFVRWLNKTEGMDLPEDYQATSWDFDDLLDRETMKRAWHGFLASDLAADLPPLVPPETINALSRRLPLHLVTNFPLPHMEKRFANLERHGIEYHSLDYCGLHTFNGHTPRTKAEVISSLREDGERALFVDDHPDNCLDVHTNCPDVEVWLMSRRFNRDFSHPEIRRAEGWEVLISRLNGG